MLPLFYIKYIKTTGKYSKYSPSILQNTARGTSTPFWGNPILPRSRSHMLHCVLVPLQRGPCTALNVPSTRCSAWPQGPAGSTSSGRRTGRSASLLIQPHSTSHLTPPHTSLHLTPPQSTKFHLSPPHSTSLCLTPPHSASLRLTPPIHFCWLLLWRDVHVFLIACCVLCCVLTGRFIWPFISTWCSWRTGDAHGPHWSTASSSWGKRLTAKGRSRSTNYQNKSHTMKGWGHPFIVWLLFW